MKTVVSFSLMIMVSVAAMAADNSTYSRRSTAAQWMAAPRAVASKNQISMASVSVSGGVDNNVTPAQANGDKSSIRVDGPIKSDTTTPPDEKPDDKPEPPKDNREKERLACLSNNIGVGNTFVWASKYSNILNYSSMVEDVENPENNVCFVRVEIRSDDAKVSTSDMPGKYFEMGQNITCGSWVDADKLKSRILDSKKSARTWGTVAGVVGGAGLGVGLMELFGNRLIGGAVEGQKGLERSGKTDELLRSQLAVLKKDDLRTYNEFIANLQALKVACDALKAKGKTNSNCDVYDYDLILGIASGAK